MNEPIEALEPLAQTSEPAAEKKRRFPLVFTVFYLYFAVSAILLFVCLCSPAFADTMNRTLSAAIRAILAHLTNAIPFSVGEFLLLSSPLLLLILIAVGVKKCSASWRDVGRYCAALGSLLALVGALFLSAFAPGYHGSSLDQRLGLDKREVSATELYSTARILVVSMERELSEIDFSTDGFSVMPYDRNEMNDRLLVALDAVSDDYGFPSRLSSRIKPVMISRAMSYTHITGVYSFFTGEANLNVDFPDYTLPYTAAHELAHQRGVAREDEANFVAFLVCTASDDPYLRYCGYRNLYDYVISALYSADPTAYSALCRTVPREILREQTAYSRFFDRYRDSAAADVSEVVNDTFLSAQGTEGTKSYGMVVDLAVAYYRTPD